MGTESPVPFSYANFSLLFCLGVGRGLAPAAEKWNIFRIARREIIILCLRHGILRRKMPGGSKPPPYGVTMTSVH